MKSLDIKINIKELLHYSASLDDSYEKKTLLLMIKSFSEYVAKMYISLVREAIYFSRYRGSWEPVSEEGYLEYIGVEPSVHILESIKNALEVKKIGYNYVIRINPYYEYPNSDTSLLRVLRAIENGTSKFNARPLLYKVISYIQDNIINLWKSFLMKHNVI